MRKVALICLPLFFFNCSQNNVPKGVLAVDKMEKVVFDILRVDEYLNNFVSRDTTVDLKKKRSVLYGQVFKLHNTNRKEFYTSFKFYQRHPDIQKTLFDSLIAKTSRTPVIRQRVSPVQSAKEK